MSHRKDAAVAVVRDAVVERAPMKKAFVTGSRRCGECHEKMFDEWQRSAHANSQRSALYQTTAKAAGDVACGERCHAPLMPANETIAREGVTCDVCHTLRAPKPSVDGGDFHLATDDMVKYGPRCDLNDHYFHRMGCSPEHAQAELCGTCHWWEPAGVPVFTEYKDWKAGPAAAKGQPCQTCHMPVEKAALANGSPVRTGVPHHGLLGLGNDLRARMIDATLSLAQRPDGVLEAEVHVVNATAGHYIPSGLPERRLRVTFAVHDGAGAVLDEQVVLLGRTLVDARGNPVPFWAATKMGRDTRIAPGDEWWKAFDVSATKGEVTVEVAYLGLDPVIAKSLAVGAPELEVLATLKLPLGGKLPMKATFTGRKRSAKAAP